ncbi:MAG: hypothetical protein M1812_003403 [Candelaria pacifica]|nr:MAG: hypothetical protein M1812_003403 [Candelaria pacifica]
MADLLKLLKAILPCLPIGTVDYEIQLPTEKTNHQIKYEKTTVQTSTNNGDEKIPKLSIDEAASSIITAMLSAEKPGTSLNLTIQSLVHQAGGWSEYLATKILNALETFLKAGKQLSPTMQEAYDKACEAAKVIQEFSTEHPIATEVLVTIIALGILVILVPYVLDYLGFESLEYLGFAESGPMSGKFRSLATADL